MGEPAIGSTLAGYRIDAVIARGGMGVVYRATQLALERPVALKVIAHEFAGDEKFRRRFLSESRLAARLDHPAVVPVYDAREEDGELIVAMRLIEGGDLRKLIDRDGPIPTERAIRLLGQVAEGLDAAHAAGIVHRDVKPHNILVEGERAYLSDFGLAKAYAETGSGAGASVVGTVEYMAPEQWRGERIGPAADVYALGCVLYEALTGVVPYARKDSGTEPHLPRGMDAVIERAVAREPTRRYRSATALMEAARECQGATPAATRVLSERPEPLTRRLDGASPKRGSRRPRRLVVAGCLAGAALLATLVVFAIGLLGDDGVSVSEPIAVASPPLRLAVGPRTVWVTSAREGTLSALDPETLRVLSERRIGRGAGGVTIGAGSVWVSNSRTGTVLRVDPDAGVIGRISVGGKPGAIAFGGDRVWVADEDGAGITAINATGGEIFRRGIAPHIAPLRLAVGAGGLWVSSATTGAIRRVDLGDAVAGPPIQVGRGPAGITVARGYVWVANSRSATVARVDPSINARLGEPIGIEGRLGGIDAGTDVVWVANATADSVSRIGLESAEVEGGPVSVGPDPGAVVVGEEAVWVANNGDGTVTRIEP